MGYFRKYIETAWYQVGTNRLWFLYPFMFLYRVLFMTRTILYKTIFQPVSVPVPLIVVGNLTVGGTGKTPVVIALTEYLKEKGFNPGVVSRGYGGHADFYPLLVNAQSKVEECGDEPLLIFTRTGVPVAVDPKRSRAAGFLVYDVGCDVIISDDGLQHHAMDRDFEIVVLDAKRAFGNGFCLPLGPLRESKSRLKSVDLLVINRGSDHNQDETSSLNSIQGYETPRANMRLQVKALKALRDDDFSIYPLKGDRVHAVAGIGNPERFFRTLEAEGYEIVRHVFEDHYRYKPEDLDFGDELSIIMTEKDAVKCMDFELKNLWYLAVDGVIDDVFYEKVNSFLAVK